MAQGKLNADDFATKWTVHNPPYAILKWEIENFSLFKKLVRSPAFLVSQTARWYMEMDPSISENGEKFVVFCLKMDPESRRSRVMVKGEFTVHNHVRTQIFGKLFCDIYKNGFKFRLPLVSFSSPDLNVPETFLARCEMVISVEKQMTEEWQPHLETLSRDFRRLYLESKFADFAIRMQEDAIGVHKALLCARLRTLSEVLSSHENYIFVNENPPVVRAVLLFIYSGNSSLVFHSIPVEAFGRVTTVAIKWQMDELVDLFTPVKISCKTRIKYKDFLYTWQLRNFSNLPYDAAGCIKSEEFASDANTKWKLVLQKTTTTYGLHLESTYPPDQTTQAVDVQFTMYNKKSNCRLRQRQELVLVSRATDFRFGYSSFAEETYLSSQILKDDVLFIDCKLRFRLGTESRFELQENLMDVCEDSTTLKYLKTLSRDLGELLSSGRGSDVTLISGLERFETHSFVLWARSPYFQEKLCHSSQQFLTVPIESGTMRDVLAYLYSGELPALSWQNVLKLYKACALLGLPELGAVCRHFILRHLNVDVVLTVIAVAVELYDKEMEEAGADFVCIPGNAKMILNTQRWKTFRGDYLDIAIRIYHKLAWDYCNHISVR